VLYCAARKKASQSVIQHLFLLQRDEGEEEEEEELHLL
jgi:hypothetical protein